MSKKYLLIISIIVLLASPCVAYNGRDLIERTELLVNAIMTGDDFDKSFVKRQLNIECNHKDIADTQRDRLETIRGNFLTNPVTEVFKREGWLEKFNEFSGILEEIFSTSDSGTEKAACIIIAKSVTHNLFGTLCASIKGELTKPVLEESKRIFLASLEIKPMAEAEARSAYVQPPARQVLVSLDQLLAAIGDAKGINEALPFTKGLTSAQLEQIVLHVLKTMAK